jgi:hypothetical protein
VLKRCHLAPKITPFSHPFHTLEDLTKPNIRSDGGKSGDLSGGVVLCGSAGADLDLENLLKPDFQPAPCLGCVSIPVNLFRGMEV